LLEELEKLVAMETVETEALIYVAGYVAHRFRHKYPDLGVPTATLQLRDDWLSYLKAIYLKEIAFTPLKSYRQQPL